MKRYILMDGEIKSSLLLTWIESRGKGLIYLKIDEATLQKVYHKTARLVLEVSDAEGRR